MVAAVTTNGTRPKPETWRDWMSPGEPEPTNLLTRDEMIERLRAAGVAVTPRTLVYWEGAGALPRPVRHWHAGAVRAVYPEWVIELAANVQAFRRNGVPLREIGPRLRVLRRDVTLVAKAGIATGRGGNPGLSVSNPGYTGPPSTARRDQPLAAEATDRTDEDMEPALATLARRYTELSGRPVVHLEARFTDHAGHTHTHRFPPSQDRHDD